MVVCLERGADLHMAQLMPLLLTVSCFSKIQIGFTYPGSPGQKAVKRVCVCVSYLEKEPDLLGMLPSLHCHTVSINGSRVSACHIPIQLSKAN